MSNVVITVTAYGNSAMSDLLGIEAYAKPGTWVSQNFSFGVTVSFQVTGNVWSRLRPQLNALANRRIPAMDVNGALLGTGKTQPALSYSMEWVPGDRPRIHRALIGVAGGTAAVAATGQIEAVESAALTDAESFVLDDGVNPAITFEFDNDGSVVPTPTLIAINFVAAQTAATVATNIAAAINGVGATLAITAVATGSVVALTNDATGVAGNVNIINNTVMDITGMAGGAAASTATNLSIGSPGDITLEGTNLLAGVPATSTLQTWSATYTYGNPGTRTFTPAVDALRLDSTFKGPFGNKICYTIEQESGAGSVTVRLLDNDDVHIVVVPAVGLSNSTAIAAQIAGSPLASAFVNATVLVPNSAISPTSTRQIPGVSPGGITPSSAGQVNRVYLEGGDGGGLGVLMVPVTAGLLGNMLYIESTRAGNDRNLITLTITANSGVPIATTVSGNNITVALQGATDTLANIAASINGSIAASALASATAMGVGSLGATPKSWLYGGGGEAPVATVAGAAAAIVSQVDQQMVVRTTNPALIAAGATPGQIAALQVQMNYGLVAVDLGNLVA